MPEKKIYKEIVPSQQDKNYYSFKSYNRRNGNDRKTHRMLLRTDSHGRNLAFHLNIFFKSFDVGVVRPWGLAEQVLNSESIDGDKLGAEDVLLVACGFNYVSCNEVER